MATETFNRGLNDDFITLLNAEYEKGTWWRNLVDDAETFVAIREDYLNVYYRGCSLLKLDYDKQGLFGHTDYKYLVPPGEQPKLVKSRPIKVVDGKPANDELDLVDALSDTPDQLRHLKNMATRYVKAEKSGVHDLIHGARKALALDIEIAFPGAGSQIDLAALHESDNLIFIRFYEAKHFSRGRKAIRAAAERKPTVLLQMDNYGKQLTERTVQIRKSYRTVCHNLSQIRGLDKRHPERHSILQRIVDEPAQPHIDIEPCLLIVDFNEEQRNDPIWKRHEEKLVEYLGEGRLRMVGDPKALD